MVNQQQSALNSLEIPTWIAKTNAQWQLPNNIKTKKK